MMRIEHACVENRNIAICSMVIVSGCHSGNRGRRKCTRATAPNAIGTADASIFLANLVGIYSARSDMNSFIEGFLYKT